jgi:heptosyltransferase-3
LRILIYRLGSLGDTVVALPCFRLIARAFPHSERRVLTNVPINAKAPALSEILNQSGLVNGYFEYPVRVREFRVLFLLAQKIRRWKPDVLVYLAEPRSALSVRRDLLFFRLCGISRIVGAPTSVSLRTNLCSTEGILEYEASRLARCLAPLGDARLDDQESWNLSLSHAEQAKAEDATATMVNHGGFLACSAGTKIDVKDWG